MPKYYTQCDSDASSLMFLRKRILKTWNEIENAVNRMYSNKIMKNWNRIFSDRYVNNLSLLEHQLFIKILLKLQTGHILIKLPVEVKFFKAVKVLVSLLRAMIFLPL